MMIRADKKDRQTVVDLLALSFERNPSVAYLIGEGAGKPRRLRRLMAYAFEVCLRFGEVWLHEDRSACALVLYPHLKGNSIAGTWLDLKLATSVVGISRLAKVLRRERLIKGQHPDAPFCYLWFIGVHPSRQGQGLGSAMLESLIASAESAGLPVCLETSVPENVVWYQRFGFEVYHQLDLSYRLFFLRHK